MADSRGDAETFECAICYEEISQPTVLPCDCKVSYCLRCWDRSLASSFLAGDGGDHLARCPTCRSPVHVDFDATNCRLVFTRECGESLKDEMEKLRNAIQELRERRDTLNAQDYGREETELKQRYLQLAERSQEQVNDTIERLARQAIPAMEHVFEQYREQHYEELDRYLSSPNHDLSKLTVAELKQQIDAMGGVAVSCVEKGELVECLVKTANDAGVIASLLASSNFPAPACVCGSKLKRVSTIDRVASFLMNSRRCSEDEATSIARELQSRGAESSLICDICENQIKFKTFVWTCENRDATILHPTTYDVCGDCFVRCACRPTSA